MDGQVGAIFLCARGIGLELLGEEDLFKRCLPKIIRASPSRCSTTRISAACPGRRGLRGGRACRRPLFGGSPSPGAGYDLRIDTGEVIGSGLYWEPLLAHLSLSRGRDPGPFRAPGSARPAQPQPEARRARSAEQATGCARMM